MTHWRAARTHTNRLRPGARIQAGIERRDATLEPLIGGQRPANSLTVTLAQSPTNARRTVLLLGFLVAVITYLDRVCISVAAPSMTADLGLSTIEMGYVFSAFALAYGIFEIPMGWLGDRYGQRRLLTRIVICWSVFTIMTGMARSYMVLAATRFIFGAAEAGAFPTLARALARWFPVQDRGHVNGTMWMGARIGGALAPAVAVLLIAAVGWRVTFAIFGAIGFVWCAFFWPWYRDDPADHSSVNAAELDYITSGKATAPSENSKAPMPWGRLFRNRTMWFLFAMYFCSAYGYYFFVTWLPTYLMDEYGLTLQRSGFSAGLPLAAGAIGCISGGTFSDWLVRRTGSMRWGRRLVGVGGFVLAAVGFAGASMAGDPLAAVL